ncbi:hypothetical protein D3C76_1400390 [compost metagenome]
MSGKGKNPDYFGVDTEVFQYLLERDSTHPGLWTRVDEIQERLAERMGREVSVSEIANAVACTHYTRLSLSGPTDFSAYNQCFTDGTLTRLKLVEGVSQRSWEWGW